MTKEEALSYIQHKLDLAVDDALIMTDKEYEIFSLCAKALEQEPRCKECKWWKDSDNKFRRGVEAESKCPINHKEVYEGNGYCFLYEPKK